MTKHLKSDTSHPISGAGTGWVKLGILAAASALAGGIAAAWWYRKTLKRLQEGEDASGNPHFGIPEGDLEE